MRDKRSTKKVINALWALKSWIAALVFVVASLLHVALHGRCVFSAAECLLAGNAHPPEVGLGAVSSEEVHGLGAARPDHPKKIKEKSTS
jgi:hypothetical protein